MKKDRICLGLEEKKITVSQVLFLNFFQELLQKLTTILIVNPNEIKVWEKVDRYGNAYWKVYDPVSGKYFSSGSEADICAWIEQLYR